MYMMPGSKGLKSYELAHSAEQSVGIIIGDF